MKKIKFSFSYKDKNNEIKKIDSEAYDVKIKFDYENNQVTFYATKDCKEINRILTGMHTYKSCQFIELNVYDVTEE